MLGCVVACSCGSICFSRRDRGASANITRIAVGSGRTLDNGTKLAMDVKPGDRIIYSKYSGSEIKLEGKEYLIISEKDVLAVFSDERVPAGV